MAVVAAAAGLALVSGATVAAEPLSVGPAEAAPRSEAAAQQAESFQLVGHNGLFGRGMNAAPAIYRHYLYVGNRTDGQRRHPHAGVQVVDIARPKQTRVVGSIGPPNEGNVGETSRELRVWPQQKMLIVMNFTCSSFIHDCADVPVTPTFKFYDLSGKLAAHPRLLTTYVPPAKPHEMFLWVDPNRSDRALLYYSTPTNDVTGSNLVVADISNARDGDVHEVASFNPNRLYPAHVRTVRDVALHSISLNPRGTRAYLAYLGGGFLIADTSDLARNRQDPRIRLVTPVKNRVPYTNPGAHSAVKVPGRPLVVLTEEVYGDLLDFTDPATGFVDDEGCPWGWVKIANISDPRHPRVVGQYRTRQNHQSYCSTPAGRNPRNTNFTSYAAHNPTVLPKIAFVTWHTSGLQAFSTADPAHPQQTGVFSPRPLRSVATEDPALSKGINK
ncbi:MAG: hypothetical protein H0V21_06185, partial [Rubrobacter sp.]|nr:hypothetical protein [Rubrobacter sp.]